MPAEPHQQNQDTGAIREIVFGMEDGMVSTLGAITGIATGTNDHFTIILSGLVIIAVESISMGVGSYLSNKSEKEMNERKIAEERMEIKSEPEEEEAELRDMYVVDGWPKELAGKMAAAARKNPQLFLQEMAFRELQIVPENLGNPLRNGLYMLGSYVFGGFIPLGPYLLFPEIRVALSWSIPITLLGLFLLGVMTAKFTRRTWWKSGLEMLVLASAAAIIGYTIGKIADGFIVK